MNTMPNASCAERRRRAARKVRMLIRIATAATMLLLSAHVAHADDIVINGLPYNNVRIEKVEGSLLYYISAAGAENREAIANVQIKNLTAHPQVAKALAFTAEGKHAEALAQYEEIRSQIPWVRQWVTAQIVTAATAAGNSQKAINAYLDLVQTQADPYYFEDIPIQALAAADDTTKQRLVNRIRAALEGLPANSPIAPKLRELLEVAQADDAMLQDLAAPREDAVILPKNMRATDPTARLLREGKFEQALESVNKALNEPGGTDMKLYQRGVAQLKLAEALEPDDENGARKLYKDAGLSFMRCAIHFPRSPYLGPSLMEAGYVHMKIGRPDIAAKLFDEAMLTATMDPEENPGLAKRLDTLRQQVNAPNN